MIGGCSGSERGLKQTRPPRAGPGPGVGEVAPPPPVAEPGWRFSSDPRTGASLGALNASVRVPGTEAGSGQWLRRFLAFLGPGYMVPVGYMDPGNLAPDMAGGYDRTMDGSGRRRYDRVDLGGRRHMKRKEVKK